MKKQLTLLLGVLLLTAACSGNKKQPAPEKTSRLYYNTSYNPVWQAAVVALDKKGMPIVAMNRNEGIIQTGLNATDSYTMHTYFNSVSVPCISKRFRAVVFVTEKSKKKGKVAVSAKAYGSCSTANTPADRSAKKNLYWVDFKSTGELEKEIIRAVTAEMPPATLVQP